MGTVREVSEMSRYIDTERIKLLMKQDRLLQGNCEYQLWKQEVDRQVNALPYIELDDYVPKDFHDKTCEAMAKAHQEEIADMVSVVRCKECRYCKRKKGTFKGEPIIFYRCEENNRDVESDDFCTYGEREGE